MTFHNSPSMKDENNEGKVKKFVHQPLTFDHFGIRVRIKENGRVVITSPAHGEDNENMEYDQVEVPASLIFAIVTSLKLTRIEKWVSIDRKNVTAKTEEESE